MTWAYIASGLLMSFMALAVAMWSGSLTEKNNGSDAGFAFVLSITFLVISAVFLFSAGIEWSKP